ncbi:MAG: hypothetical protein PHQ93_02665 [Sulfurimonas sp.]|uniref:hypothetical protein n=1 Tax=Sulfurimonas sp. TaxID=2022749 RepID=UPI002632225A|nr:hypothetical protein [Sulfurimonas sp.]MDD5400074.1 hypothetical protein [Sulfurimonas sp.]
MYDMLNNNLLFYDEYIKIFYIFHIIITTIISLISARYMQKRFFDSKKRAFIFMFLFNISLPVIGYFFSYWISYYLKNVKYEDVLDNVHVIDLDEFENYFINVERAFGESSMYELMQNDYASTSLKIKALVSMSDNISQKNINIIKYTLSSNNDEVRLFSFAIIDKIERGINGKIHQNLEKFKQESDEKRKALIAKELAALYWEMIYYELSESSLKDYYLSEVLKYIKFAALSYPYDLKLNLMLGRVYMLQKNYDRAATEFSYICEMNLEENQFVGPYLAEINFNAGNYRTAKSIISELNSLQLNSTLYPIFEQWRA